MLERTQTDARAAIVAEAYSWLRTPYHHHANVKGVGVDCAMLLREVYVAAVPEIVPPSYDPRPYSPYWYLHQSAELYLMGMEQFAHPIAAHDALPGDVDVYRFGRTASHGAIIVSAEHLIHANHVNGNVELIERRALVERFDSTWSVF